MASCPRCEPAGGRRGAAARRFPCRLRAPILLAAFLLFLVTRAAGAFAEEPAVAVPPGTGEPAATRLLAPGDMAPGFLLRDAAGEGFSFEGENLRYPYLLVFWSMFCEPCRLQLAADQVLGEKYRDSGLRVTAISLDGEPLRKVVAGFVRQEAYTFQVVLDELDGRQAFRVADAYGVTGMPSTVLVDRGGRIVFSRTGLVKAEELEKAVQSLLRP